jgi:transcriptional regulator with XRE-family HTH domain
MSETFAQRLRRLRNDHGYSVADLASTVGASEGTIRQLENGSVKSPSLLLGVRLAERLHVDARYLALGDGATFSERFELIEKRLAKVEQKLASLAAPRR